MNCFREREDPQLVELTAIPKSALQQSQQNDAKNDSNQGETPKPVRLIHRNVIKQYEVILPGRGLFRVFLILNNLGLGPVREIFTVISRRIEIADGCVDQNICLPSRIFYLLPAFCHTPPDSIHRLGFSLLQRSTAYWQH